jgi:hypothetical protein
VQVVPDIPGLFQTDPDACLDQKRRQTKYKRNIKLKKSGDEKACISLEAVGIINFKV